MPDRLQVAKKAQGKLFETFAAPSELILDHGEGVYLFDHEGKRYMDFCGSPQANNIGHGDPRVTQAVVEQMKKVAIAFQLFWINELEGELAKRILKVAPQNLTKIQFTNSGSEATETAIKLAHQYHIENGKLEKHMVISRWQSYHGMTLGALSVSGHTMRRDKFGSILFCWPKIDAPLCYHCPYELSYPGCGVLCAKALDRLINQVGAQYVSAFIAEPIGGAASGAMVPVPEYYPMIREICDKHDVLFIDDEIQGGFGRSGKWFAIDHWGVSPDIILMGKGVSSVYTPLAAVLSDSRIAKAFEKTGSRFIHAFTTAGNPVSCAVGLAVIDIIEKEGLVERSARLGEYMHKRTREKLSYHPTVGDIRGKGLVMGVELVKNKETKEPLDPALHASYRVHQLAMGKGCMIYPVTGTVQGVKGDAIMISPPFIITESEIDTALDMVDEALTDFEKEFFSKVGSC